jgi:hypothetical protein
MRPTIRRTTQLALASLLTLTLCASIGVGRVQAQDKMAKDKMRTSAMMDDRDRMMREEDEEDLLPTTPSYPWAAPGTLDLNYWTDVTRKHMMPGSASEARMDKMRERDRNKMTNTMHEEDEEDLLPVTPSYPWAAPGSLDLNYWTDISRKHMMPGSASEARMDKMMKKDTMRPMK